MVFLFVIDCNYLLCLRHCVVSEKGNLRIRRSPLLVFFFIEILSLKNTTAWGMGDYMGQAPALTQHIFFSFSLFFLLLSKLLFNDFSAVDPIVSVFRIDKLDVGKREMANLAIKFAFPLAVDMHFGDFNSVAHLQT